MTRGNSPFSAATPPPDTPLRQFQNAHSPAGFDIMNAANNPPCQNRVSAQGSMQFGIEVVVVDADAGGLLAARQAAVIRQVLVWLADNEPFQGEA